GLYQYDGETLEPRPAVARSVDISADKCVWTFHLRPEAKWNNGDPVTTRDFLFAWKRMLESPAEYTYLHYYIKGAENYVTQYADHFAYPDTLKEWEEKHVGPKPQPVPLPNFKTVGEEALDDHTLRVTLHDPIPFLLDLMAYTPFYPLHEKSMAKF